MTQFRSSNFIIRMLLVLVATFFLFAHCLVECSPELRAFMEKIASVDTAPLPKQVVRNDTRLLFVAGLEGSGHHGMADMFKLCANTAFCKREDILSSYCVSFDNDLQKSVGLFAGGDGPRNHDYMQKMLDRMDVLSSSTGEFTRMLYYLGLSDEKSSTGM